MTTTEYAGANIRIALNETDIKALRTAESVILYHGNRYSRIGCDSSTSVLICKWHEKLSGSEVEYTIPLYGFVTEYGCAEGESIFGARYYACSHSVDTHGADYGNDSCAIGAFIAMAKAGDSVDVRWTRSTTRGTDSEDTRYHGMMRDRVALRIQRTSGKKEQTFAFPIREAVSFDETARMVHREAGS